jgi:hypothetical protein
MSKIGLSSDESGSVILNQLLWDAVKEQSHLLSLPEPSSQQSGRAATGPGQVNLVSALFDQDEKVWITQPPQNNGGDKEKIIISCGDFTISFQENWEQFCCFWKLLVVHKEVYLWQGNVLTSLSKSIKTAEELWDNIATCVMASANDVQRQLHEQGLYRYIILDFDATMRLTVNLDLDSKTDYPIKLYPDWHTFTGRQQLLSWLKAMNYWDVKICPTASIDAIKQFRKLFNENRSAILTGSVEIEPSESWGAICFKSSLKRTDPDFSRKIKFLEKNPKKWPDSGLKLYSVLTFEKEVNLTLSAFTERFSALVHPKFIRVELPLVINEYDCELKIPPQLLALEIRGRSVYDSIGIWVKTNAYGSIWLTGGENLEYLSLYNDLLGNFSRIKTTDFLSQPYIVLPNNLPRLKSLELFIDAYHGYDKKDLSSLANIPNLQFLSLIFLGSHDIPLHQGIRRIRLTNLLKVRQMEIHHKFINEGEDDEPENVVGSEFCDIEIDNAPNLEILLISNALAQEVENYASKIKIIYRDCPRLKFVKSNGFWVTPKLTAGGHGEINFRGDAKPGLPPSVIPDREEIKLPTHAVILARKEIKRPTHVFSLKQNCVSYFQRKPVLSTTTPAGPGDKTLPVKATAPWKCLVQAQDPVKIRDLVWGIYGHLQYDEKTQKISLREKGPQDQSAVCKISQSSAAVKKKWLQDLSDGNTVGIFSGPISTDTWHLLPMQSPLPVDPLTEQPLYFEVCSSPSGILNLLWDRVQRRYYVRALTPPVGETEVVYRYRADDHYRQYSEENPQLTAVPIPLIHPGLKKLLFDEINRNIPDLKVLTDDRRPLNERFHLLIDYCSHFEQKSLATPDTKNGSLAQLLAILKEKRGVCQERSLVFYVLALCLGIQVEYIRGDGHARIELVTPSGQRYLLDLGGGTLPVEIRDEDRKPEKLTGSHSRKSPPPAEESVPELKRLPDNNFSYQLLSQLVNPIDLESIDQLFAMAAVLKNKTPLLILPETLSPLAAKNRLARYLRDSLGREFIYIDTPAELARLLRPVWLDEKTGRRDQKDGPLADILRTGGVILFNLTGCDAEQLTSNQSLFDQEAQLLGRPVPKPRVQVIGLGRSHLAENDVFISRCQQYHPPQDWLTVAPQTGPVPEEKTESLLWTIENPANWQAELLAGVRLSGTKTEITDGLLMALVRSRKDSPDSPPVIVRITNAPLNDRQFELLCDQINHEGRFYFNGEWWAAAGITLIMDFTPLPMPDVAGLLTITTDGKGDRQRIYLRPGNLHELDSRMVIDSHSGASDRDGLLSNYDEQKQVFYLTRNLTQYSEYIFKSYLKKYQRPVTVLLAPDVTLENKTGQPFPLSTASMASCLYPALGGADARNEGGALRAAPPCDPPSRKVSSLQRELLTEDLLLLDWRMEEHLIPYRLTNDPDYDCQQLAKEYKGCLVMHVSALTTYSDLLALLAFDQKPTESLRFIYQPGILLTALKAGRQVIISGELPEFLHLELLSALDTKNPYLESNGERIDLKPGQLICVLPDSAAMRERLVGKLPYVEKIYRPEDFSEMAGLPGQFLQLANLTPQGGVGCPALSMTYQWFKNCHIAVTQATKHLHPHNPLKGLTSAHYLPDSVGYQYLNVLGKYFFAPSDNDPVRIYKIRRLFTQYPVHNTRGLKKYLWWLLNCFNGKQLRKMLGDNIAEHIVQDADSLEPTLGPALLKAFYQQLQILLMRPHDDKSRMETAQFPKRERQLLALLRRPNPIINIEGPPGVGKSFFIEQLRKLKQLHIYAGWKEFPLWLTDRSGDDTLKIWLGDELNLKLAGSYAFLFKGLCPDSKVVVYEQQEYSLTAGHKIIVVGNPAYHPNRHPHPELLQNEILIFKMPSRLELVKLARDKGLGPEISGRLVKAFLKVLQINPRGIYSLRDLEDCARRFQLMQSQLKGKPLAKIFFLTCQATFVYGITEPAARKSFLTWLVQMTGNDYSQPVDSLIPLSLNNDRIRVPGEYLPFLNAISLMFILRKQAIREGRMGGYKQGLLIEGPPGIGKSTWFEAFCQQYLLLSGTPVNPETEVKRNQKKRKLETDQKETVREYYFKISGGTEALLPALERGIREDSVIMVDEFNRLTSAEEEKVNHFLTGTRGLLLASRNPVSAGSSGPSSSQAVISRMQKMTVGEPSPLALLKMARDRCGESEGGQLTATYLEIKKKNPQTNTRHFFQMLALRQTRGPEKSFLLNHVLINTLRKIREELRPKTGLWSPSPEMRAIETLIQSFQGPAIFTEEDCRQIRSPVTQSGQLVEQFVAEGGKLPETFIQQEKRYDEPDWDEINLSVPSREVDIDRFW